MNTPLSWMISDQEKYSVRIEFWVYCRNTTTTTTTTAATTTNGMGSTTAGIWNVSIYAAMATTKLSWLFRRNILNSQIVISTCLLSRNTENSRFCAYISFKEKRFLYSYYFNMDILFGFVGKEYYFLQYFEM